VVTTPKGVQLVFRPPKSTFKSFKEEKAEEKAREKGLMVHPSVRLDRNIRLMTLCRTRQKHQFNDTQQDQDSVEISPLHPPHVLSSSSFTAVSSPRSPPRRRRASARDARRAAQDEEDRPKSAGDMEGGIEVCLAPHAPRALRPALRGGRRAAGGGAGGGGRVAVSARARHALQHGARDSGEGDVGGDDHDAAQEGPRGLDQVAVGARTQSLRRGLGGPLGLCTGPAALV
jgi:hypothetical protein